MINYHTLILGDLQTNCYLLWEIDSKECYIIDPADDSIFISEEIQRLQVNPIAIILTHGHGDHTGAVLDLRLIFDIPLYANSLDKFLFDKKNKIPSINKIDIDLNNIKELGVGKEKIKIIKTPGHTPGSLCFYINDLLFSGDTIFKDYFGRTDLPYSNRTDLKKSLEKLIKLPKDTIVLPGHEDATTIEQTIDCYFATFR